MKTKIIFSSLILFLFCTACNKKKTDKPILIKNNALIIGNPFDYGIDNILLFPVGSNYNQINEEEKENSKSLEISNTDKSNLSFSVNASTVLYDRTAEKEFLNTDEDKFDIRNILFYDLKTGLTYPLVNDTLHILSFALHREFGKPLIFYRIVKNDYNGDSIFNSKDPVMLYSSDLFGKNFTQITPENEHFSDYTYYKQTQTILIKTIIDSDKDKNFTNFDETNFREMKTQEPSMGREIFTKSLKDSLRSQIKAK